MELSHLKDIAAKLNMNVHHNIGIERLRKQIDEQCEEMGTTFEEVEASLKANEQDTNPSNETPKDDEQPKENTPTNTESKNTTNSVKNTSHDALVEKLKKLTFTQAESVSAKLNAEERLREANKLIRCIVTCNNKNKSEYQGEIFSVQNAKIKEIKKFVPFGEITHIPQIVLNMIQEKKYQMFKTKRENGIPKTTPHLIAEYNVQILPPITKEELEAIKQKQLAEGFNGE